MSRLLLTAAVLAVLVYTMVLGVRWLSPRIEQDIAERVTTGLAEQGLLWADVAVEGRDVVLTGTAPDADAKARAMNVATRVFGVSKVQDNLTVAGEVVSGTAVVSATEVVAKTTKVSKPAVAKDYALTIVKEGEKIVLEGSVPDEASKDVLVKLATNRYEAANVDATKLNVVEGAPAGWRSAVGAVLMHISNMEEAKAIISGTEVMVSGSVLDKQYSDKMEEDVSQVLPKEYKAAFAVDVVSPTVVDVEPAAGEEAAQAVAACSDKLDLKAQTLMFAFDKADLTPEHKAKLKVVGEQMTACVDEKMVLAGFTDVTGSKLYNKWLSQQRAEAAMRALMRDGVAKERLQAVGYGELHPVAANTTKAGRAANRRVEFHNGDKLPYEMSVVAEPAKKAAKPAPKAKKVVAEQADKTKAVVVNNVVVSLTTVTTVSGTDQVSETTLKPWWARKDVSETAVEVK